VFLYNFKPNYIVILLKSINWFFISLLWFLVIIIKLQVLAEEMSSAPYNDLSKVDKADYKLGDYPWHEWCMKWDRATVERNEAEYQLEVACRDHGPDSQIAKDAEQAVRTAWATWFALAEEHDRWCPRDVRCGMCVW
jgi:hypothetical protein